MIFARQARFGGARRASRSPRSPVETAFWADGMGEKATKSRGGPRKRDPGIAVRRRAFFRARGRARGVKKSLRAAFGERRESPRLPRKNPRRAARGRRREPARFLRFCLFNGAVRLSFTFRRAGFRRKTFFRARQPATRGRGLKASPARGNARFNGRAARADRPRAGGERAPRRSRESHFQRSSRLRQSSVMV